jgi:hypothetical protein
MRPYRPYEHPQVTVEPTKKYFEVTQGTDSGRRNSGVTHGAYVT